MSRFVLVRGAAVKLPETEDEVEALLREAEAELTEQAARVLCARCAAGLRPRKGPNGWEHPGVPGYRDPFGCDAATVRDLTP